MGEYVRVVTKINKTKMTAIFVADQSYTKQWMLTTIQKIREVSDISLTAYMIESNERVSLFETIFDLCKTKLRTLCLHETSGNLLISVACRLDECAVLKYMFIVPGGYISAASWMFFFKELVCTNVCELTWNSFMRTNGSDDVPMSELANVIHKFNASAITCVTNYANQCLTCRECMI